MVRHAIGVDVHAAPLLEARDLLAGRGRVQCLLGDGASLTGVPDASIDAACAFTVFQHLPCTVVGAYLAEVRRVLRPEGRAGLQFYDTGRPGGDVTTEVREQSVGYSPLEIQEMFSRAGLDAEVLERESLESIGRPPGGSMVVGRRARASTGSDDDGSPAAPPAASTPRKGPRS